MSSTSTDSAVRHGRRPVPQLVGISLAYFMVLLDTTVLAVAEPDIISTLPTDIVGVGWATTAYTIALASALVLCGSLGDRVGPYRVFTTGVMGFSIASLGCALAPALPALLGFRALQGLFAAAIIPSSLSLIASLFPDAPRRGRAISIWAAISGVAMAAGPVIGGLLVVLAGWRVVFVINVPIAVVVLVLCRSSITSARRARAISYLPHVGLAVSLAIASLAITQAGQRSWGLAAVCALIAVGLALGVSRIDRRSSAPLLPASLRRNGAVWISFGWGAAVNYALTTVVFSIPLVLETAAVAAGMALLPMTLLVAFNPLFTGRIIAAHGALLPIRMGFFAFTVGLLLVATALVVHDQPLMLSFGLLASGLGVSWTLPALVGFAINHAGQDVTGAVSGGLNATRQVGATIAAATASAILARDDGSIFASIPFGIAAVVCGLSFVTSVTWRGVRP